MAELLFTLDVREPHRRRIQVTLVLERTALGQNGELMLPVWTPGSYLVREFANQLGPVRACDADSGQTLPCAKTRKNRFRIDAAAGVARIRVDYSVYAHELTVRTSDLTSEHAFWNHACVLLWPADVREQRAIVTVLLPPAWDLACGLPHARGAEGERVLAASTHDDLIDSPILCGRLLRLRRDILGVAHELAFDDLGSVEPSEHLLDDVQRIVERAAEVFGGPLPYATYCFLCLVAEKGHGGLEHSASSTLLSPRTALRPGKAYREFLGLLAHELFHAWNVKRMRPRELWTYDYENENHTALLWLAEGFTAYYDDLLCRRAGVLSVDDYLTALGRNIRNMQSAVGRFRQSLAEASYDAWIRFYRPDENTRNSTQNYYGNGAVVAMVMDLTIRRATAGKRSLDDAMRELYGSTFLAGRGYDFDDVARCCSTAAGTDLTDLLRGLVQGPLDPEIDSLLSGFGVQSDPPDASKPYLGFALTSGTTKISMVGEDGPAHAAGLAPGDEILAVDDLRTTSDNWSDIVAARVSVGAPARLLVATRGLVRERVVVPTKPQHPPMELRLEKSPSPEVAELRRAWLAEDVPLANSAR